MRGYIKIASQTDGTEKGASEGTLVCMEEEGAQVHGGRDFSSVGLNVKKKI